MDRMTIFVFAHNAAGYVQAVICEEDYPHFQPLGFVESVDYVGNALPSATEVVKEPADYQHLQNVNELYHSSESAVFDLLEEITGAPVDRHNESIQSAVSAMRTFLTKSADDTPAMASADANDNPPPDAAKADAPAIEQDGAARAPKKK